MTDEEYLQDLVNRCGMTYDEMTKIINCYVESVIGDKFKPLLHDLRSRIHIRPVKIKTLKERLEELIDDRRRTNYKNVRQTQ